jgi:hypothetical protein
MPWILFFEKGSFRCIILSTAVNRLKYAVKTVRYVSNIYYIKITTYIEDPFGSFSVNRCQQILEKWRYVAKCTLCRDNPLCIKVSSLLFHFGSFSVNSLLTRKRSCPKMSRNRGIRQVGNFTENVSYGNKVKDGQTVCYHKLFFYPSLAKYPIIENGHFWTKINVQFQIYRVSLEFGHIYGQF